MTGETPNTPAHPTTVTTAGTFARVSPLIFGVVSAFALEVFADAMHRGSWDGISRPRHFAAALLLSTSVATIVALGIVLAIGAYRALERALARRFGMVPSFVLPLSAAALGAAATYGTAFWTFTGERVRGTIVARIGPWLLIALAAALVAAFAVLARRYGERVVRGSAISIVAIVTGLLATAAALVRADFTLYVSLYSRLHTLLESSAVAESIVAMTLLTAFAARASARSEMALVRVSGAAVAVTLVFLLVPPVRRWTEESLRHAWREPVYVGRLLSRLQIVEGFVRDPRGWRGATMSSVVRLRERFDIATTSRSPIWDEPAGDPPWLTARLAELRGKRQPNVIVYYVDTLRADVASDPRIMPNTVKLASRSIDFRRAYTTGSDTLHALPGIVGGSYDLFSKQPNDVLSVARGAGYKSVLFVARSAREFLSKLMPDFAFPETVEVTDYARGNENVWGYGADQPTAGRLVDRALDWFREHRSEHSLLWLFNFDVHNWRELDEAYVRDAGKKSHLFDETDPVWRYRTIAHLVDTQLGRLLDGLRDLDADRDTVLLFVSDHGEGLGREGFWVHSVFLWEALVHVPLLLHIPGATHAVVNEVVSLVDIAPTLSHFMSDADVGRYQGEDLLTHLVADHPKRRLPLLLMGTLKEVPVRLGIIDPESPWKLVLPLEGAVPELYDLRAGDPDARDVAPERAPEVLRLLNELVRAPLFPRLSEVDSNSALDRAAVDGKIAIEHEAKEKAEHDRLEAERAEQAAERDAARDAGPGPRASLPSSPDRGQGTRGSEDEAARGPGPPTER